MLLSTILTSPDFCEDYASPGTGWWPYRNEYGYYILMMSPPGSIYIIVYYLSDFNDLLFLYCTIATLLLQDCKFCSIVCRLFCLTLSLFLPVISSCWLNRPVGTKEMSSLTGLWALHSVLSSERRSLTYPKSACFQKSSWAVSRERALRGQRFRQMRKAKTTAVHQWRTLWMCTLFKAKKLFN